MTKKGADIRMGIGTFYKSAKPTKNGGKFVDKKRALW